jgi:hypothetical protein
MPALQKINYHRLGLSFWRKQFFFLSLVRERSEVRVLSANLGFANIHRCGLLAVKSRAREYGYFDIEDAAAKLIEMISSKNSRR